MKPPSAVAFPSAREMPSTLYFWWLVYLRSSLDYWWICHEKGKCNDPRLVKVWKDFGNLFQYNSALDWWNDRGAGVFDNPQKEIDLLTPLGSGIQVLRDEDLVLLGAFFNSKRQAVNGCQEFIKRLVAALYDF